MPPESSARSMSPGELATCEDFLDTHREYAINLLSDVEEICRSHETDSCPQAGEGQTCVICELCSAVGLIGAAKNALGSYDVVEQRLNIVRASLGKTARARGEPGRQTLFRNDLAKTVFLSIVTEGDALKSQHAAWQARLQSEILALSSENPRHSHTDLGDLVKRGSEIAPLSTYPGSNITTPEPNPKLTAVPPLISRPRSNSSMFVVLRRCLSSDCPCEANKENIASRDASGLKITSNLLPPHTDAKKTSAFKVTTKSETTRGSGNDVMRSVKTRDTSNVVAKAKTSTHSLKPSLCLNAQVRDAPKLQDGLEEQTTSSSTFSQEQAYGVPIVDPRVFHLQTLTMRSDDVRKALMEWCRACIVDLQSDLRVGNGAGLQASESTTNDTHGPSACRERAESEIPLCTTGLAAATRGLPHGDKDTMAHELQLDSEQEELKGRWLIARQKRCRDRRGRSSGRFL